MPDGQPQGAIWWGWDDRQNHSHLSLETDAYDLRGTKQRPQKVHSHPLLPGLEKIPLSSQHISALNMQKLAVFPPQFIFLR